MYNFKEIEEKWQKKWQEEKPFKAIDFHPTKPKYYILYEFYNISGNLHIGHLKGTVPADALARMKRLQGYNVLFPIGGDSFGLPAENAAIKNGTNPRDFVSNGMKNVLDQSRRLGLSFDYDRTIVTSDPEYYKWTQWIFLQLLKHDKAYKEKGTVNYCPNCQTVLSNEDSQGGKCDRCNGQVIQVERDVWFLKMKEYSEKLLGNIDRIEMSDYLKEQQRNWIGKSEGVEVKFKIVDENNNLICTENVFTTHVETIYGVTYLVLAPEHELIEEYKNYIKNINEVENYKEKTTYRSELDRIANQKDKTGCILNGIYAINPITKERIPVYTADFVLNNYGTGVVMGVPAHDDRDLEFAQKFNLPIRQVIEEDKMINSANLNGYNVSDAKSLITEYIVSNNLGQIKTNYKMQDWSFNRQRYWGEPFPVIFCDDCGVVPVEDLPVILPETNDYLPNQDGSSPLSKIDNWVKCTCPKCGKPARRETDTMPNWAGSSWYWLRYTDPKNPNALADYEKLKYWGSVDCYTGGTEHITRHVLYAFFWQNFLYDIGVVPNKDPFKKKMGSGLILDETGKKMSKSSKNGVSPMEVIDSYGTDAARLHLHFLGSYEDSIMWTYKGINGIQNFLNKVWSLMEIVTEDNSQNHDVEINNLIKKVTSDIENLKLNTAIASLMEFVNKVKKDEYITKEELRSFLILLNPLAPHISSEMYERVFGKNIIDDKWPTFNEKVIEQAGVNIVFNVNNKKKLLIKCPKGLTKEEIIEFLFNREDVKAIIDNRDIQNIYYVPDKMINVIIAEPKKMIKKQ